MDIFMLIAVLFIVFLSTCLAIIVLSDSDILTFIAVHFGKAPNEEFNGKVIWITGCSSGIGEALAKEISSYNNVRIVISARRKDELDRVKKQCLKLNSSFKERDIYVLPFDMTEIKIHQEVFDAVLKQFVGYSLSNAGRSQRAIWHKTELEVDRQLFDLNVFSIINLNRIVVKYFMEIGGGHLVVNSSTLGKIGAPYSGSYTASKHAIHGYFDTLRYEVLSKNIFVTILCPGPTFSGILGACFTEEAGKELGTSMKTTDRRMTAERCAFLSSVAIANKIDESWIGIFPIITLLYVSQYLPYLSSKIGVFLAKTNMFLKLRDSRVDTVKKD